jgi:hypothetical protein
MRSSLPRSEPPALQVVMTSSSLPTRVHGAPVRPGEPDRTLDPRAAWLELDTEEWTATYRRVEYEIDRAAEAIEAAGLPSQLARRLYVGQ